MPGNIAEQMQQLYSRFGAIPGVHIELHTELLAVRIENQVAVATIFLQGAQLSEYTVKGQEPLIWCSESCDYTDGKPLRGGIPICWPWFGDLQHNPTDVQTMILDDTPAAHGFVRNRPWNLTKIQLIDEQRTDITLNLEVNEDKQTAAGFNCELQLVISVGATLSLEFTVKNRGNKTVCFASALHSYFSISDIDSVAVNGLENVEYIDCVDNWSEQLQNSAVVVDKEIDHIYQDSNKEITIVDQGWKRVVSITSEGSNSTVLWNPWIEKSKRLSNFDDQDYRKMLCIETANIRSDSVQLQPGATHLLRATFDCAPMS